MSVISSTNPKYILCDIWGVIHGGSSLHFGVLGFLRHCLQSNIKVVLFSNAPRLPEKTMGLLLSKFGLQKGKDYHEILTSGGFCAEACPHLKNKKYLTIGSPADTSITDAIGAIATSKVSEVDFCLINGEPQNMSHDETTQLMRQLILQNVVAECPNPDLGTTTNTGEKNKAAGFFGREYEKLGGKVNWYGKPYVDFYKYAATKIGFKKHETIAIGDTLETDIVGANNFGIKSVLVLTGNSQEHDDLSIKPSFVIKNIQEMYEN